MPIVRVAPIKKPYQGLSPATLGAIAGGDRPSVLFRYMPQGTLSTNPGFGGTFTRADASTCATYVDANGVVQTVAANIIRDGHYVNGVRTTLLEGSRQNAQTQSSDLTQAGVWTPSNATPALNATGPDGVANSASTLTATSTANCLVVASVGAVTAGQKVAMSAFVKQGTSGYYLMRDAGDASNHDMWVNMATGAIGTTANVTSSGTQALTNGWYRVWMVYTATNTYTHNFRHYICDSDNSANVTSGRTVLIYGSQCEINAAFPSSYIATGAAAVTRAADALSFPFGPVPQSLTVYCKGVALFPGTATGDQTYWQIGGGAVRILALNSNGTNSLAEYDNGASRTSAVSSAALAYGDTIETRTLLTSDGTAQIGVSRNGGAESLGTQSAATALPAAWSSATLYLTANAAGAPYHGLQEIVVLAGNQSLAACRAA